MAEKTLLSISEDQYDAFIDGFATAIGIREDGQTIAAGKYPQAVNHPTYNADRQSWQPSKEEAVLAHIEVEAHSRAAQGYVQKQAEELQKKHTEEMRAKLAKKKA